MYVPIFSKYGLYISIFSDTDSMFLFLTDNDSVVLFFISYTFIGFTYFVHTDSMFQKTLDKIQP